MIGEFTAAFPLTFVCFFPIVNPLQSGPLFLDLTRNCTVPERNALVWQVTISSFLLLLGSMLLGPWALEFFGIDLPVVRIVCPDQGRVAAAGTSLPPKGATVRKQLCLISDVIRCAWVFGGMFSRTAPAPAAP